MDHFFKKKILYNWAVLNFWKLINYHEIQQFVYKNSILEYYFQRFQPLKNFLSRIENGQVEMRVNFKNFKRKEFLKTVKKRKWAIILCNPIIFKEITWKKLYNGFWPAVIVIKKTFSWRCSDFLINFEF